MINDQVFLSDMFERTRNALLNWIDSRARCVYGQFPQFDMLIDKFEEDVKALRLEPEKTTKVLDVKGQPCSLKST